MWNGGYIVQPSFTGRCVFVYIRFSLPFAELLRELWLRSLYWTWINIVIRAFDAIRIHSVHRTPLSHSHHYVWCCEGTASRRQHKCTKFEIVWRAHSSEIKAECERLERGWRLVSASEIESQTKRSGDNDEKVAVLNKRTNERNTDEWAKRKSWDLNWSNLVLFCL